MIDVLDLANVTGSGKFDSGLAAAWGDGDFNYDGVVDSLDVADFLAIDLFDAGSYNAPGGSVVAVPEPTVAVLVGVAAGLTAVALTRRTPAAWSGAIAPAEMTPFRVIETIRFTTYSLATDFQGSPRVRTCFTGAFGRGGRISLAGPQGHVSW